MLEANINYNITLVQPSFEDISITPGKQFAYVKMQVLNNSYPFKCNYHLELSRINSTNFKSDLTFYRNWEYSDNEIQSYIYNSDRNKYWLNYISIYNGKNRNFKIVSLDMSKLN